MKSIALLLLLSIMQIASAEPPPLDPAISRFLDEEGPSVEAWQRAAAHYRAGRDEQAIDSYQTFLAEAAKLRFPEEDRAFVLRDSVGYNVFIAHARLAVLYQRRNRDDLRDIHLNEALNHQTGTMNLVNPGDVLKWIANIDAKQAKK